MHGQGYLFSGARVRLVVFDILIKRRMGNSKSLEKVTCLDNVIHALAPVQLRDLGDVLDPSKFHLLYVVDIEFVRRSHSAFKDEPRLLFPLPFFPSFLLRHVFIGPFDRFAFRANLDRSVGCGWDGIFLFKVLAFVGEALKVGEQFVCEPAHDRV